MRRYFSCLIALAFAFTFLASSMSYAQPQAARTHIVSYGLWGDQSVFRSEATGAATIIDKNFGGSAKKIVRFNSKVGGNASLARLQADMSSISRKINPEKDVVFLILTSHGTQKGVVVKGGSFVEIISPNNVAEVLEGSGAKYSVVIVSACYSGIFTSIANSNTLVITAASSSRTSFGCKDGNRWTYFGEAFFANALRQTSSLPQAFEIAKEIVAEREQSENFQASNPQMSGGENVLQMLAGQ
jgi:Peptidase C13 family